MEADRLFMQRALELARLGLGSVSPNPMVGCVIVHHGKIIGEGWHRKYGGPHAEVLAVEDVLDPSLLTDSTVYVSLEPCAHTGKTPPCADLLVSRQVKRVVVCNRDPNPLVAGKGLERLADAGIAVDTGILEEEGRAVNKRFFTAMEKKRPYIILKWAETADGYLARKNYDSRWISNDHSRKLVHKWRAEEDAILVGTNTAQHDDPRLNVRDWRGKDPVRVVIDRSLRLTPDLHLFDGTQPTICYNLTRESEEMNLRFVKLEAEGFIPALLTDLFERNICSLLVEGGSGIHHTLLKSGLWDEARVFTSRQVFGDGIAAPEIKGRCRGPHALDSDQLVFYQPFA